MARRKLKGDALCPCGSGKKYKNCCYDKGFQWVEDDDGTIYRSVPISSELMELLADQRRLGATQ